MGIFFNKKNSALPNARNTAKAERVRLSNADIRALGRKSGVRAKTDSENVVTRYWVNGYEVSLDTEEGRENIRESLRASGLTPLD